MTSQPVPASDLSAYFGTKNAISLSQLVFNERDEIIRLRRHIHRNPELSLQEHNTSKFIVSYLRSVDPSLIIKTGIAVTGISAVLIGKAGPGPCIAIRADMDALPVQELDTDPSYISTVDGVSHCCGHVKFHCKISIEIDTHVAILMVTAKILCSMKAQIKGSVKFIFQPAEEAQAGAEKMVKQGVLKGNLGSGDRKVDQIYGLHIISVNPLGTIRVNKNPHPSMSGACTFYVDMVGKGGHGAAPQYSNDPVIAAASLVQQIHTVVSRNIDPIDMGVLGVGSLQSGTKGNVIPETAKLSGTMRWFTDNAEKTMKRRLQSICDGIAKSFEMEVTLTYDPMMYPALLNDAGPWEVVCNAAQRVVGDGLDKDADSVTGSEDFSYYLREVPGCFFFLGAKVDDGKVHAHHAPGFAIDERALVIGVQTFVNIITDLLIKPQRPISKL